MAGANDPATVRVRSPIALSQVVTHDRRGGAARGEVALGANQQVGRFGLIREIARGGMGKVFLARDTALGRKVAIKFLLHYDPNGVDRFLTEARATARCTHENIVTIYELGEHQGMPYMVLEYLEGRPLNDLLEQGASPRQFAELMVPVVRALEETHALGIVHRDLKPPNIFITDRGQVKVLDFGIAHVLESLEQRVTASVAAIDDRVPGEPAPPDDGAIIGTLPYMSPEQWGTDRIDASTDLWAIGMMFWRALAGVHPAGSTKADKLRACMRDLATPLPSIATKTPEVPPQLAAIVDRCCAKRKAERYASAAELLADLQAFLGQRGAADEDTCPYRGLAAFGEQDARFFFGRASEIRMAQGMLERWPVLAVVGASGVGKSSFVQAGLVPALRATGARWSTRYVRPGRAPLARLVGALGEATAAAELDAVRREPGRFGELVRAAAAASGEHVLLFVDQLEELFTLCPDEAERATFLTALLSAADDPAAPARVVVSMRADFVDRFAAHRETFAELSRGLLFLAPPEPSDLRETLVRPAELAGYRFEQDAIVDDMVRFASNRGALPLLSFAASRLWDARDRTKKLLTAAAYAEIGGAGGAFARHADRVASAVPSAQQPLLRAVLLRLVTPDGTRAIADQDELRTLAEPREVDAILDRLVDARLVNVDRGTVEIVHEALLTEWATLRHWLDDGQAARGFVHELQQAARNWAARGRTRDLVWHGVVAQDALAFARRNVLELSGLEREYLAAVRALAVRARRRRAGALAGAFAALGLVIAGGAVALLRISAAEDRAEQNATLARDREDKARDEAAAANAEKARADQELNALEREQAARAQAEAAAKSASTDAQLSRDQLVSALATERQEKARAQAEAAKAQKASAELTQANAKLEQLLKQELEREKEKDERNKKLYGGAL